MCAVTTDNETNPHGMRSTPPTGPEVIAVARLWCERSEFIDNAVVLLIQDIAPHGVGAVPSILYLDTYDGRVVYAMPPNGDPDATETLDDVTAHARGTLWQMIGPDGPLTWERVAELVAALPKDGGAP